MEEEPLDPETSSQTPRVPQDVRAKAAEFRLLPVPQIPRGPLWITLAIPPVLTLVTNMGIGLLSRNGGDGGISLLIPPIMFFVIIGFCTKFHSLVKQRYKGRSLVFLNFAYFFGQVIVCLALWIGSCVLFFIPNFH
jgi:hypothetical protein